MAFESLSGKLQGVINKLKGKSRVTEEDVKEIAREVKLALLEADVNYKIVKDFTAKIFIKVDARHTGRFSIGHSGNGRGNRRGNTTCPATFPARKFSTHSNSQVER